LVKDPPLPPIIPETVVERLLVPVKRFRDPKLKFPPPAMDPTVTAPAELVVMSNIPPEATVNWAVPPEALPIIETDPPLSVLMTACAAEDVPIKTKDPELLIVALPAAELAWNHKLEAALFERTTLTAWALF
jgi:hypothetical protein